LKFSILLPTRNRLDLLKYAIESVRRQDYPDWEIIVSDNASEDDIRGYIASLEEPRISLVRTPSFVPVTDNWNNALKHATGDYVLMLGDDDAIMPGYFTQLARYVKRFEEPDVIYTEAYQFAYPNVIPGRPSGFVQQGYAEFLCGQEMNEPFWLNKRQAQDLVAKSMSFRLAFGFNMQHYLVHRRMVEVLSRVGEFYQSPYPDYYAANALLLEAEKILVVPNPMVAIGISPKSFGYYYFNNKEPEGDSFLKNIPEPDLRARLEKVVLPGSSMIASWLYAMETLKKNFDRGDHLRIDYDRYRLVHCYTVFSRLGLAGMRRVLPKLSVVEFIRFSLLGTVLVGIFKLAPKKSRPALWARARNYLGVAPAFDPRIRDVPYQNILEMVESESPNKTNIAEARH